jgi:hypothetical protein
MRTPYRRGLVTDGWSWAVGQTWRGVSRLRHRLSPKEDREETRLKWIREHASGHSFADIGGMYRYTGDIAFLAEEAGATSVTMFDVGDPDLICDGHPEWGTFAEKHKQRQSKVRYVQGDLEDPAAVGQIGVHDIVFFSGVLYHTPNPVLQLMQLRQITGQLALISTLTIPEIPGFKQACIFYPYLDARARAPYAMGYLGRQGLLGIDSPIDERPMYGYANCWWGITRSALLAMLATARFEVVEERRIAEAPFMAELVVRPLPLDPLLPPVSYFRERAAARERGEPSWPFDTWYDEQRRGTPDT